MTKARDLANASTALSAVSATELAFVDGVTSAIQTQMDAKAPSSTAVTLTGTQTLTNKTLTSPVLTTPTISTVNAKGDLLAGTADNTVDRLAVGSDGDTIVADSSTSTGLRYTTDRAGAKNGLINSAFDVSQRGATITGISLDNTYTADRWYVTRGGNIDYALKTVAGANNPPTSFDAYGQYINQTATNPFMTLNQTLETKDSIRFAGATAATLSFYARATANTVKSKSITASIGYNTTADAKINTLIGTTTFTTLFGTASTDWTFCTLTVGIPSNAKTVGANFVQSPSGGLAVGDGFEITGVQLERAPVATAFQRNSGTIQGELSAAQRYYYRTTGQAAAVNDVIGGWANSTTSAIGILRFPMTMRIAPTCAASAAGDFLFSWSAGISTITGVAIDRSSPDSLNLRLTTSGLTTGQGGYVGIYTGSTKWLEASAEL